MREEALRRNEAVLHLRTAVMDLKQKKASLEKELEDLSFQNFKTIVYPIGSEMRAALSQYTSFCDNYKDIGEAEIDYKYSEGFGKIQVCTDKESVRVRVDGNGICFGKEAGFYSDVTSFAFLEKEVCEKIINAMYIAFEAALDYYADRIQERKAYFESKVKGLEDLKAMTFHINNREDGSVEIYLNGKTYIGTVKEEV